MRRSPSLLYSLMIVGSFMASTAHAQYTFTGIGPGSWGASDSTLGVAGDTIENFESANLTSGLRVQVSTSNSGSYGPTSTLPNIFDPTTDPFGTPFVGGNWDGSNVLVNTGTNQSAPYTVHGNWGVTTFFFPGAGAKQVGFSLEDLETDPTVFINGANAGSLLSLTGLSGSVGRNGYIRIDAVGNTAPISSLQINNNANGDGYVFDHVAFQTAATPEPSTFAFCLGIGLSGAIVAARRRRRR